MFVCFNFLQVPTHQFIKDSIIHRSLQSLGVDYSYISFRINFASLCHIFQCCVLLYDFSIFVQQGLKLFSLYTCHVPQGYAENYCRAVGNSVGK